MARKIPPAKILINRAVDLAALRHPSEKTLRNLNVALGAATLVGLAALTWLFPKPLAAVFAFALFLVLIFWIRRSLLLAQFLGNAAEVSADNFPELHYLKDNVTRVLGFTRPFTIHVSATVDPEPAWLRAGNRRALLLNDAVVAAMIDRNEIGRLNWLLGRMIGLQATRQTGWLARVFLFLARLNPLTLPVFNCYRRLTHFTADRVGLALNLSLIDAAEAVATITAGELHTRMNVAQLERQAELQRRSAFAVLYEIITARPAQARRFTNLVEFCREQFPDLYADFELHRHYAQELLPSYREIQEFSEGKEEERKIQRELGKLVYELMSAAPPLNEADEISRTFLQLHRNRDAATELEGKISRLHAANADWQNIIAKITAAEGKRENATRALEASYRELGRTAFTSLLPEIPRQPALQKIFEKAWQYHVVISDRERESAELEAAAGNVLDKSKRRVEIISLRTQNSNDTKRLQAAAEGAGEEFWRVCADQFEQDDLEPLKLRITGLIGELERRRVELDNLYAQRRHIESRIEQEGLPATSKPDADVPVFVEQLKNQARAANALRPRLMENLGKAYWQHETHYLPETRGVIEQLNDLKKRIRAFEQEEA